MKYFLCNFMGSYKVADNAAKIHNPPMQVIHLFCNSRKLYTCMKSQRKHVCCNLKTYYMWLSVITLRYGINSENETNQTNVKFCVNVTCLNACFGVVIHVSDCVYIYSVSALSIYYIHVYPFRKIAILILEYSTVRSRVFVVYMFSWYFECTVYNAAPEWRHILNE